MDNDKEIRHSGQIPFDTTTNATNRIICSYLDKWDNCEAMVGSID